MARGDQIYVLREFLNIPGVYEHHGIDCGDGTVIHYQKSNDTIGRTSMATFTAGRTVYVKRYPTCFIPEAVVARAESRLGESRYNLLFNNCEHFATWCKTGRNESQQVQEFLPSIRTIAPADLQQILEQALGQPSQDGAPQLLTRAMGDIAQAQRALTAQFDQAQQEVETWHRVAQVALQRQREDLARAALYRKVAAQRQIKQVQTQLHQLAIMTSTLQRNSTDIQ